MVLPPFQALIDEHGRHVWRTCAALVGPQEADDCYQDTMLSALRAYPKLRDARNLKGWLLTIASRKALDSHRARGRRPRPVAEPPERAVARPPDTDDDLWGRVRALPAKQRAAVVLRFVNDLPYAQVGRAIGCSEASARQNVRHALMALREDMT